MASGICQKTAIFHLHVKSCIYLAGLGINEQRLQMSVGIYTVYYSSIF